MLTVCCVYRTGGDYGPDHVAHLAAGVKRHLVEPHQFLCLTDDVAGACSALDSVGVVGPLSVVEALRSDWPGWWAKLEAFVVPPPVFYLDLDSAVVGDLRPMADAARSAGNDLLMLRDFYRPRGFGSGVMAWARPLDALERVYRENVAPRARWDSRKSGVAMQASRRRWRGDQDWIADATPRMGVRLRAWQDVLPGAIASYKVDVVKAGSPPEGAAVVCFHGRPRPQDIDPAPPWLVEAWGAA